MPHNGYRDLKVWQKSVDLSVRLYRCTRQFPSEERYGLISQIRRAGVSIPANIAEGYGRSTLGEYRQGLSHARGSLFEVETDLEIAFRLAFLTKSDCENLFAETDVIGRMLTMLKRNARR